MDNNVSAAYDQVGAFDIEGWTPKESSYYSYQTNTIDTARELGYTLDDIAAAVERYNYKAAGLLTGKASDIARASERLEPLLPSTTQKKLDIAEDQLAKGVVVSRAGTLKGKLLHFGSPKAAKAAAVGRPVTSGTLTITNPARLVDSGRSHDVRPDVLAEDLVAGTPDIPASLVPVTKKTMKGNVPKAFDDIATALKTRGYDGIVYVNANEDPGSISYIALSGKQFTKTPTKKITAAEVKMLPPPPTTKEPPDGRATRVSKKEKAKEVKEVKEVVEEEALPAVGPGSPAFEIRKQSPIHLTGNKSNVLATPESTATFETLSLGVNKVVDLFHGMGTLSNSLPRGGQTVVRNDLSKARTNALEKIKADPEAVKKQIQAAREDVLKIEDTDLSRKEKNLQIKRGENGLEPKIAKGDVGAYLVAQSLSSMGKDVDVGTKLDIYVPSATAKKAAGIPQGMPSLRRKVLEAEVDRLSKIMKRNPTEVTNRDGWELLTELESGTAAAVDPDYISQPL